MTPMTGGPAIRQARALLEEQKRTAPADPSFRSAVAVADALLDEAQAMVPPPEDRVEAEGDGMETLR